jgi:hypothetical protein
MKDSFDKIYNEIIDKSNHQMISEGKIANTVLAGIAGLGITGGALAGLNKVSQNTVSDILGKYPKAQEMQVVQEPVENDVTSDVKTQTPEKEKINDSDQLSQEELFIARVLYSETSYKATYQEILMVCQVIINRINNRDFGNGQNAFEVVKYKNAFSCINDSNNVNWNQFKPDLNSRTKLCCKLAKEMMRSDIKSNPLFNNQDIVYYHDNSISTPKKWTNKYWRPIKVYSTKNFQFFKVVSNIKRKSK